MLSVIMLRVIMLSVIMPGVIMPGVIMPGVIMPSFIIPSIVMLNAFMLNVVMTNVVAHYVPISLFHQNLCVGCGNNDRRPINNCVTSIAFNNCSSYEATVLALAKVAAFVIMETRHL
jgi:hypothetical protein